MPLEALIFDVDGTLAETEELHRAAFNAAFAAAGLAWHWDIPLYTRLLEVTGGKERIRHHAETAGLPVPDDIAALHADKTARYVDLVRPGAITLRPAIAQLLTDAKAAGLRLAIATTTSRANVDALLAATLATNPFEVIAAGDEVPAKKPSPDIYHLALSRLGLPATACIALEDTQNGLTAATRAGLRTVITPSLYGGRTFSPQPLLITTQPTLAAIVKALSLRERVG